MSLHASLHAGAPLLRMKEIGKSFSGVSVLSAVGFELHAGEVHALAGENGAGKSTLMKILAGVYDDYLGSIELEGQPVRFRSPREATDHGISIIHQEMSLIGPMNVLDNIFLGREAMFGGIWRNVRKQRELAAPLFREVGLDLDASRPAEDYPVSVQQLIEIAKALSVNAKIIIMDEPTSSLNDPEVERLFSLIALVKARGVGIIYITHKMEEIYRVADRITVLRDGRVVGTAEAHDLSGTELVRWMVGREISQQFPRRSGSAVATRLKVDHVVVRDPHRAEKVVVNDISFEAGRGEILGVAGLQGSGNSELLNGLFGVYGKLAGGSLSIDGRACAVMSPRHAVREGFALLTNDRKRNGLVMEMGIPENMTLAALRSYTPHGWLRPAREKKAALHHADALHLRTGSIGQEVGTLSGGNQQKVVLAKWLETKPRVFLMDEPTRGVDVAVKHEIYELMYRWAGEGCTIVLVTSDMLELLALADRILVLCRGKLAATFRRGDATQENITHAAMGAEGTVN